MAPNKNATKNGNTTGKPAPQRDMVLKILVVGAPYCGKTSLIRQYVHGSFNPSLKATVGVDFALKQLHRNGASQVLQLWDVAGQEKGSSTTRVYFQAAVGAVIVCDASRLETLDVAVQWKNDIDSKVFVGPKQDQISCVLLLNKCDIAPLDQPTKERLDSFCIAHRFCGWMETSAKSGTNVCESFDMITDNVMAAIKGIDDGMAAKASRKSINFVDDIIPEPAPRCGC
jgi:Ras-related protein Rab-32